MLLMLYPSRSVAGCHSLPDASLVSSFKLLRGHLQSWSSAVSSVSRDSGLPPGFLLPT